MLKYEEFVLIFRNARKNKYGKVLILLEEVIYNWFNTYLENRMNYTEGKSFKKTEDDKKNKTNRSADYQTT